MAGGELVRFEWEALLTIGMALVAVGSIINIFSGEDMLGMKTVSMGLFFTVVALKNEKEDKI